MGRDQSLRNRGRLRGRGVCKGREARRGSGAAGGSGLADVAQDDIPISPIGDMLHTHLQRAPVGRRVADGNAAGRFSCTPARHGGP